MNVTLRIRVAKLGAALLASLILAVAAATGNAQTVKFDFASHLGPTGPQMKSIQWWGDEVKKRSNGKLAIENFFYSQSLVRANDQLAAAGDGRAGIVWTTPSYNPSDMPLSTITEIPFMTENVVAWGKSFEALYQANDAVRKEFAARGVHLLYAPPVGGASIGAKKPIQKLEDLKGMKVRAFGYLSRALAAVGANPTGLSGAEIYEAVKRGVLDGYSGVIFEVLGDLKLYEVGPHLTGVGMGAFSQGVFLMNLKMYEQLAPDMKKIVDDVSREASERSVALLVESETQVCNTVLANKGSATLLPDAEVARWKALLGTEIVTNWVKDREAKGLPARGVADQWATLVAKFEKETSYESGVIRCAARKAT